MSPTARWRIWIDRGGTFTDLVGRRPDGMLVTAKLLSNNPEQYADAAVEGIRRLLGLAPGEAIPDARVESVKMGTTVATNALLERTGARTLLVTTLGFADAARIGDQKRPHLFARHIVLPPPLYERVLAPAGRLAADGRELVPLDLDALREGLVAAFADGFRACAIAFMHGYKNAAHEDAAAALAREVGFTQVSVSHALSPLPKLIPRIDTAVADAYLSPVLRRYVDQVASQLPGVSLLLMQSHGGLVDAARLRGKDAVLSGPAGGVVGMTRTARAAGFDKVIGFDMGGTSTDVAHFDGTLERTSESVVADVRIRAPMMALHTVAAGGGSIVRDDGARLRVGPASAGADPGPACYGRGGPLTVTDANLLLGKLQSAFFPRVFGPHADQPLDREVVVRGFAELADRVNARLDVPLSSEALAEGCIQIAVLNMANAIKKISVARGYDVTRYVLQCFGGAGGQHACLVADALGMRKVLVHPLAGVLSAYGMGLADQVALREAALELSLDDAGLIVARETLTRVGDEARAEIVAQGFAASDVALRPELHVRYQGTDTALGVPLGDVDSVRAAFEAGYRARFSFLMPDKPLVLERVSVEAIGPGEPLDARTRPSTPHRPAPHARVPMFVDGATRDVDLHQRASLAPGAVIDGPAVLAEANTTTVIEPGWQAEVDARDQLVLTRVAAMPKRRAATTGVDPVTLEIANGLFMAIAEQMGSRLQSTASSVNIKERLDFSCALFDRHGNLIANAPHMPVHLGSMGESIATVITRNPTMQPGDVFVLNDPYHGGTHLPDVTVVTPVFRDGAVFVFLASRGHHADLGGITPGSMPPFSKTIDEEGVLLDNFKLVEAGRLREDALRTLLTSGPYPARNPAQNVADLHAQIAANEKGVQELSAIVETLGLDTLLAYMQHVQDNAEESVRVAIARLDPALDRGGAFRLPLDNGAEIVVSVRIDRATRSAVIDFTGTSPQCDNNFNAPRAVTMAAVLYVFRTLVDDDIPLNAGCLVPLEVIVPEGSMLNPRPPAAVVAGNVEVSTCVTNAIYGALGLLASSQPTMNNFSFGNAKYQYYETIAGGSGAGIALGDARAGFDGASAVQTHMTNSRLSDPEILELRYPVRVVQHAVRAGSGGAGRFRGGDGATREILFEEAMTASILANGRSTRAFGLAGGEPGAPGRNHVVRADGTVETLGHIGQVEVEAGDRFVIETPGGGGFGAPTG
ncbi:MAG: hydantoinase B/oxoprolinase family protein [Polyangiales bacterium]